MGVETSLRLLFWHFRFDCCGLRVLVFLWMCVGMGGPVPREDYEAA